MALHRVIWEIDIEADSPLQAAQEALRIMQDHDSTATCFSVEADDGRHQVDIQLADGQASVLGPDGKVQVIAV